MKFPWVMTRLSKNIVYNLVGQGLLAVLGLVAVKYVFGQLGADALGIIYFAVTVNTILCSVLDIGVGLTTVREVAAHAQDDPGYVHNFLKTSTSFYWATYLLLALSIYWAVPLLVAKWLNLRTLEPLTATHTLRILLTGSLLSLPRSFYMSVVRGLERMEFSNLIDVGSSALQQCGIIVILIMGGHLIGVAVWLAGCFALSVSAYVVICAHFFSVRALLPGVSWAVIRRNLPFSLRAGLISFSAMVHTQADKAIVSKLLALGLFGYYSFASSAISRANLITNAVSQAAFPALSALFKAGDRPNLLAQYRKLQDLLCYGTVPLFAGIPFVAVPLFSYLLNAEAAKILLIPSALLSLGFYLNGTLNTPYVLSLAVGRPGIAARSNFYALFVVLPVTVTTVFFYGLNGAGFSWVFYHLFVYFYFIPRVCSECLNLSAFTWYLHIVKIGVLTLMTYGVAWTVVASVGSNSIVPLALAYALASLTFMFAAYFFIGTELRASLGRLPPFRQERHGVLPTKG
jgi:O-antigen/teichoic acid export membrane protein